MAVVASNPYFVDHIDIVHTTDHQLSIGKVWIGMICKVSVVTLGRSAYTEGCDTVTISFCNPMKVQVSMWNGR